MMRVRAELQVGEFLTIIGVITRYTVLYKLGTKKHFIFLQKIRFFPSLWDWTCRFYIIDSGIGIINHNFKILLKFYIFRVTGKGIYVNTQKTGQKNLRMGLNASRIAVAVDLMLINW
jgi:hypothetical protein